MNPTSDATQLPPPGADEVARREQVPKQDSKHPPLKVIGLAAIALVGFGVIGAVTSLGDDDKALSPGQEEVRRLDIVWQTKPDIRATMCEIHDSLGQYGDTTGELIKRADGFDTPEAAARLQVLVERDC